jgi:hypothetical protein
MKIGLKQGDILSSVFFNFAVEYAIRKVQENQVDTKLNGSYQILASVDDVNLLGDNINNINKIEETLIDASKAINGMGLPSLLQYCARNRM